MDQGSIGRRPIISRFARQGYFRAKTCRAKLFLSNGILIAFSASLNHKSTYCGLFSTLKNPFENEARRQAFHRHPHHHHSHPLRRYRHAELAAGTSRHIRVCTPLAGCATTGYAPHPGAYQTPCPRPIPCAGIRIHDISHGAKRTGILKRSGSKTGDDQHRV